LKLWGEYRVLEAKNGQERWRLFINASAIGTAAPFLKDNNWQQMARLMLPGTEGYLGVRVDGQDLRISESSGRSNPLLDSAHS
jgi:hypothetical protein